MLLNRDGGSPIQQCAKRKSEEYENVYYPIASPRRLVQFILYPRLLTPA